MTHTRQLMDIEWQIAFKFYTISRFVDSPTDFQRLEMNALCNSNLIKKAILEQPAIINRDNIRTDLLYQLISIVDKRAKSRQYLVKISTLTWCDFTRRFPRNGHVIGMERQAYVDISISNFLQIKDVIIGEIRLAWGELLGRNGYHLNIRQIVMNDLPVHMSTDFADARISMDIGKA
jgi:hypothetical protein